MERDTGIAVQGWMWSGMTDTEVNEGGHWDGATFARLEVYK